MYDVCYMVYDLMIIGGGPAGTAAAVYASRKRLKTLFIKPPSGGGWCVVVYSD